MADRDIDDALARSFLAGLPAELAGRSPSATPRPGDVLGIAVLVGGSATTGVRAVEPSSVFRISARTLTAAARRTAS